MRKVKLAKRETSDWWRRTIQYLLLHKHYKHVAAYLRDIHREQ